ncbi:unnamed protein product [Pseudo-nitzschia multistriata]|uniref:Uncharacterized protein n=1 Tax=Pseudo-nitzschia multistriata TaxID=183589 RepID=A0A448ZDJ7_9STRA|nr:unnamed protein product [Pseudo-nitzschia multistriata]
MTNLRSDYTRDGDDAPSQRNGSRRSGNGIRDKWRLAIPIRKVGRIGSNGNSNSNGKSNALNKDYCEYEADSEEDVYADLPPIEVKNDKESRSTNRRRPLKSALLARTKKQNPAASASRTTSMMTPDMLETLGLTLVEQEAALLSREDGFNFEYTHASATNGGRFGTGNENGFPDATTKTTKNTSTSTITIRKAVRIDENRNTTFQGSLPGTPVQTRQQVQDASSNGNGHSENKDADAYRGVYGSPYGCPSTDSTSSSSSNSNSYEPIPRDPEDWTVEDDLSTIEDNDNRTLLQYYKRGAGKDCDSLSCLSLACALPLACGLLCLDSLADTKLLEEAMPGSRARRSNKTEVLAPWGRRRTPAKTATRSRNTKKNQNHAQRRRGRSRYNGDEDGDEGSSILDGNNCEFVREGNCDVFPSSIELPVNKIIAPCW